jgi:ribosomal protein L37AE/L43A
MYSNDCDCRDCVEIRKLQGRPAYPAVEIDGRFNCQDCNRRGNVSRDSDGVHRCNTCSYAAFVLRRPPLSPEENERAMAAQHEADTMTADDVAAVQGAPDDFYLEGV